MWVQQLECDHENSFVVDTKPIPVVGYRRSKKHSDFYDSANADAMRPSRTLRSSAPTERVLMHPSAFCANVIMRLVRALRYCAARKMKYFGYKLVVLSTLGGIPVAYELVSARKLCFSVVVRRHRARGICPSAVLRTVRHFASPRTPKGSGSGASVAPMGAAPMKEKLLKEFFRQFVVVRSTENGANAPASAVLRTKSPKGTLPR